MKTILVYGDSLSWGAIPGTTQRLARNKRWPGIVEQTLDGKVRVIEENLNARTTAFEDPSARPGRNGQLLLRPLLETHAPLDLVIIMLGSNDLQDILAQTAPDVAANVKILAQTVMNANWPGQENNSPYVLLVSPPLIVDPKLDLSEILSKAPEKSKHFSKSYRSVAEELGCYFFDAATATLPSPVDGLHLGEDEQAALGRALAPVVRQILGFID